MLIQLLVKLLGGWWRLKGKCQSTKNVPLKKIYIFLYNAYQLVNSSSFAWNSKVESHPYLPHGMKGIFISGNTIIGSNCTIYQHVTIGSNPLIDSGSIGYPVVGNRCFIGAGAKIIGNVIIGDNVRIGANCVVYKDVPENCTVVSNLQKIIPNDLPLNNRVYSYHGKWMYFENGKMVEETSPEILSNLARIHPDKV